jgi:hypothetical protein
VVALTVAIEGVDEVGGGEVAHLVAGVDGGASEPNEMTLAGARRANNRQIVLCA